MNLLEGRYNPDHSSPYEKSFPVLCECNNSTGDLTQCTRLKTGSHFCWSRHCGCCCCYSNCHGDMHLSDLYQHWAGDVFIVLGFSLVSTLTHTCTHRHTHRHTHTCSHSHSPATGPAVDEAPANMEPTPLSRLIWGTSS